MMVARIEGPRKLQEICKGLMGDSAVDAVNGNVRNKRELWIEETLLEILPATAGTNIERRLLQKQWCCLLGDLTVGE